MAHPRTTPARRRRTAAAALGLTAALTLAACGGDGGAADQGGQTSEDGDVVLRFTWWGADARAEMTEEVVRAFEDENPGIRVSTEWSTWDGYWDRLATSVAANDMPDVVQMDESQIASYGTQGVLLDLEAVDGLDLGEVTPEVLLTGDVDGTIVGVPVGVAIFSVGVNPDLLERAGVPMPDDSTWTWEEFVATAAQVTDALGDEGVTGFDFFGMQSSELGAFVRQHGEEVFPRDGETSVSRETLVAFYELALELVESGAAPAPSTQTETVTAPLEQQPFGTNTSAFHLQFHTQVQAFAAASGSTLQLLRLPAVRAGEPRMVNKASMYWSISERTAHPEEAARFVDFLLNDEGAARILGVERGVPAIPSIQEAVRPELDEMGVIALEFASDMQEEVVDPPQVTPAEAGDFGAEVNRIGSGVLFGSSTPEQGADELLQVLERYRG